MYVEDYMHAEIGNTDPVLSYSQNFAFAKNGEAGTLITQVQQATSTGWDDGPPTVFVTVADNGTASATGDDGVPSETGMPTESRRNATAHAPVEGKSSRVQWGVMGLVAFMLGLM